MNLTLSAESIFERVLRDSGSDLEQTLKQAIETRDASCAQAAFTGLVRRLGSMLVRSDVSSFLEIGFRLDQAIRMAGVSEPKQEDPSNEFLSWLGKLLAIRRLSAAVLETNVTNDVLTYFEKNQVALNVVKALSKHRQLSWSDIFAFIEGAFGGTVKVHPNTLTRALKRLESEDVIIRILGKYALSLIGQDIALSIEMKTSQSASPLQFVSEYLLHHLDPKWGPSVEGVLFRIVDVIAKQEDSPQQEPLSAHEVISICIDILKAFPVVNYEDESDEDKAIIEERISDLNYEVERISIPLPLLQEKAHVNIADNDGYPNFVEIYITPEEENQETYYQRPKVEASSNIHN